MVIMMAHLLDSLLVELHLVLLLTVLEVLVLALSAFIALGYLSAIGFMNRGTMVGLGRLSLVGRCRVQDHDALL